MSKGLSTSLTISWWVFSQYLSQSKFSDCVFYHLKKHKLADTEDFESLSYLRPMHDKIFSFI